MRTGNLTEEDLKPDVPPAQAEDAPEPEPLEASAAEQAPTPPQRPKYKLDEVDLDDPDLPPSLRGKSARELAEERRRSITEVQRLAERYNKTEAERDTAFKTIEVLAARLEKQTASAPAPAQPSALDRLRQRGVNAGTLLTDSEQALAQVVEAAAEETEGRLTPALQAKIDALAEKLEAIERKGAAADELVEHKSYRDAFASAKPADVSDDDWSEFADYASAYVLKHRVPLNDRASYTRAFQWFQSGAQKFAPKSTPTATSTPAPAAPPPPAGAARPAAPAAQNPKPTSRLNNAQRHGATAITNVFKTKFPNLDADSIMEDVMNDPKTRKAFT